ncbi:hypothetical protein V8E36_007550 [Tilletia maclaganii]
MAGAPSLDLTLGGLFIGVILNVLLFGFSCVQIYLYQQRFKNDDWKIKTLAYSMFTFDFANSVFDVIFLYRLLVTNFGNTVAANTADIWFALDPVMTGLIAFQCQCFFAWRVCRLTHTWWIPAIILAAGGASFICACYTTAGVTRVLYYDRLQEIRAGVIVWLTGAALADTAITTALIWTLNKSRTGFAATDDVLTKLIRATLQTGLLTSTFAVVDLILYLSSTSTLHLIFNLPLAKLYCNTLLSSLNARAMIPVTDRYSSEMQSTRHSAFRPGQSGNGVGARSIGSQHADDLETESRRELGEMSKTSLPFRGDSAPSLGYNERLASADGALSQQQQQQQQQYHQQQQNRGGKNAELRHRGGVEDPMGGRELEKHSEEGEPVSFQLMQQQQHHHQQQQQYQQQQQQQQAPQLSPEQLQQLQQLQQQQLHASTDAGNRGVHVLTIEERYLS